uniref:Transcription factor BYE1 n=1 Tax=Kalmanozyma brasiliensis (strain GHG001) TaxID=1365824 RepID=V5E8E0_KALBG
MSSIAAGVTEIASGSQAETSSAAQTAAIDDGPRRGSRTRKQTSRAAGLDLTEASLTSQDAQQAVARSGRKRKADGIDADEEQEIEAEVEEVFETGLNDDEDDGAADEKQYCICRGKDDGTFMISCERCQDWFHTKCLGITQKAAKKLDEYVCDACTSKTAKSTKKKAKAADQGEETSEQRAENFAALLEGELFEVNADTHGSLRVVGTKYKDRFRTFLFSLKDAKNTTLHSRIASGQLKASELAKMSNEELANDTIRQATEKARLEALQRSTLRSEEAGPLRKITHKGEIEIDNDALVARDQPGKFERRSDARRETEKPPAARVTESEPAISATARIEDDDNEESGAGSPKDDVSRRSAPAPGPSQQSPTRVDFGGVWTQSEHADATEEDGEPHDLGFGAASPDGDRYDQTMAEGAPQDTTGGADDFIDSFLDGPDEETGNQIGDVDQATAKQGAERSTTPSAEPPSNAVHRYRSVIWNGLIDLPDVFAFQGHVKQVAGRSLTPAPRVWSKFFPERPLFVAGRLPTKAAIDYLLQVANAARTEILAFAMEPGASKDAVATPQDSDLASFSGMLRHFRDADRWGALHVSSSVKGSLIKDFYVVPLLKDDEVPLWLDMAESDCLGADWHTKRDRDLLVLVAVVIRDALQSELPALVLCEAAVVSEDEGEVKAMDMVTAQTEGEVDGVKAVAGTIGQFLRLRPFRFSLTQFEDPTLLDR